MNKKKVFLAIVLCILSFIVGISIGAFIEKLQFIKTEYNVVAMEDSIINSNIIEEDLELEKDEFFEKKEEILVKEPKTVKILAVGDLMFHTPQNKSAKTNDGSYDYMDVFEYLGNYIGNADIVMGNYETVSLDNGKYTGYPNFNTPKESIRDISKVGFDIISTANNHILDQGKKGLLSTIDLIGRYGMENIGTSKDIDKKPLIKDTNGIKIGYLSYTYGLNGMGHTLTTDELKYMVNLINRDKIIEDINYLRRNDVDFIISYVHWGTEYKGNPTEQQEELARFMIGNGIDIILGSHPHVIQKAEFIEINNRKGYVIYSMGNFLSNQRRESLGTKHVEDGVMVSIELEKNPNLEKNSIVEINYVPTWVYKFYDKKTNKNKYKIIPIEDGLNQQLDGLSIEVIRKELEDSIHRTKSRLMVELE